MKQAIGSLVFLISLLLCKAVFAQQNTSKQLIERTILAYSNAWASNDTASLSPLLHNNFKLRFINNGSLVESKKKYLLLKMGPKTEVDPRVKTTILSVDINGDLAHAKVSTVSPQGTFVDYFVLAYLTKNWVISDRFSYLKGK
jgi:hypothetical protein